MKLKINKEWYIRTTEQDLFALCKLEDGEESVIGKYSSFFSALDAYPNYRVKFSKKSNIKKILDLMKEIKEEMFQLKDELDDLSRKVKKEK